MRNTTGIPIILAQGSSNMITLTPHFTGEAQREFWRIWIDFNSDGIEEVATKLKTFMWKEDEQKQVA